MQTSGLSRGRLVYSRDLTMKTAFLKAWGNERIQLVSMWESTSSGTWSTQRKEEASENPILERVWERFQQLGSLKNSDTRKPLAVTLYQHPAAVQ